RGHRPVSCNRGTRPSSGPCVASPADGRGAAGMTSGRWRVIENVFHAAMERSPEDRLGYIDDACGEDTDLNREVKSLTAQEAGFERVLSSMVSDAVRRLPSSSTQFVGMRIGPYELVREISHGGMGVVYLAIRNDQHYIQTVAIKFLRTGFDSEDMV